MMKVVYLTAGAAGMYCGSCMHDNQLAGALRRRGVDCVLQPVYTPIRTDGQSLANDRVFFGGIRIYLLQRMPWLRVIPPTWMRLLDWPPLIRWATSRSGSTDAAKLGALAVSMLKGAQGHQAAEVDRLVKWLADDINPDAIVLSNLLIGGALPLIRDALPNLKTVVVLQGDDIFLDHLPTRFRDEAVSLCSDLLQYVDHVIVNSQFYGNKMGSLLTVPQEKLVVSPLSLNLAPYAQATGPNEETQPTDATTKRKPFRLGYLARVAPEKGLHHLVEAFITLSTDEQHDDLELHVAGWLGDINRDYFNDLQDQIAAAGLNDRYHYHGSPDLASKIAFLQSLDLLSVPTDYEDPKGLFVLEALAVGVPVVQPNHGAFGELIASTGGGVLYPSGAQPALCAAIESLKLDHGQRKTLALEGKANVYEKHSIDTTAAEILPLLQRSTESLTESG